MATRREVLAATGAVVAGAVAAKLAGQRANAADAAPAVEPHKVGWAIMAIGKLTQGQILPGMEKCTKSKLVAFITGHPDKTKPYIPKFNMDPSRVYGYDDFDKIAADPAIEAVYNVLPNGMHAEYTIRALKAGKHVLCEKPMANSAAECQSMIDAAKVAGKKLMIAYRIRREPNNIKAIELVRGGTLGRLRLIITDHTFNLGNPAAWRLNKKMAGGGALVDVGIYGIQSARYLSGEEPVSVTAQRADAPDNPRFKEVEESMAWTLKFPSGCMATLTASYNAQGTNRCRLIFEHGMIDMEPATSYHGVKMRSPGDITQPDMDQFTAQVDYFSDCIVNNQEVNTPGEEGLRDQRIIEAIYEAANTGREVKV